MQLVHPVGGAETETNRQRSMDAIPGVISQHVEEAASLRHIRSSLVNASHIKLKDLGRLDERIAAHLDGIALSGPMGGRFCLAALERPGRGEIFTAGVDCIENRCIDGLERLIALAEAVPEIMSGLHSAFGWVSAAKLRNIVSVQLERDIAAAQLVGIAACALHRVDPGRALDVAITSPFPAVRTRAIRCAGETGRRDLLPLCLTGLQSEDAEFRFCAAQSALLLGDRDGALATMVDFALQPGPRSNSAIALAIIASNLGAASSRLKGAISQAIDTRAWVHVTAHLGDTRHIPWLIELMTDEKFSRIAGDAFSFITGVDLSLFDLDREPPEDVLIDANDISDDPDTSMDGNEDAPWPDAAKVARWWNSNAFRYRAGECYFVGAPPSLEHCLRVLGKGYQRQRFAAAQYLCLLNPGSVLFNCAAPGWRQLRSLRSMA